MYLQGPVPRFGYRIMCLNVAVNVCTATNGLSMNVMIPVTLALSRIQMSNIFRFSHKSCVYDLILLYINITTDQFAQQTELVQGKLSYHLLISSTMFLDNKICTNSKG